MKRDRKEYIKAYKKANTVEFDGNYMELLSGLIMTEKDKVKADKLMKLYVDFERIVDKINDFLYQEYKSSRDINKVDENSLYSP